MKMTKLATLFLAATLSMTSGAVLAANSSNNGTSNAAADAGQVAPGAKQNVAPNNVGNDDINTGHTNTNGAATGMSKEDIHKNTMCKDGRCPDINKKVETGDGVNNDVDTKTDGTTH